MSLPSSIKKTISSILVLSVLTVSISSLFPQKANAQFNGGGGGGGGVNLQGVGGVIASCSVIWISKRIAARKLQNAGQEAVQQVTATISRKVPVKDADVENEATMQSFKEECLDALARFAVLKVMNKVTMMTVEWINSGFEGNPFYPENRPNFFESIARDEVLSFTGWFSADAEAFPFGRLVSETILMSLQNTAQSNFRYSLQQVLAQNSQYATYENFQADFSVGGWAGYRAFSMPNNNPFGNYLMANSHLARQTAGTSLTVAANFQRELSEAGGILNQRECVAPTDYIPASDNMHLGGWPLVPPGGTLTPGMVQGLPQAVADYLDGLDGPGIIADGPNTVAEYNFIVQRSTCTEWKTLTPGRFIAEQTSQALGSPLRNMELADEFNENLGLIFDALILKLVDTGLRKFTNSNNSYSSNPSDTNFNPFWAGYQDLDNTGSSTGSSGNVNLNDAFSEGESEDGVSFNLITIQQQYVTLAEQVVTQLSNMIRDIRALDYCVPGPNPLWYQNGYQNLQDVLEAVPAYVFNPNITASEYYAERVSEITGVNLMPGPYIQNHDQFWNFVIHVFNKYAEKMLENYALMDPPPTMRTSAASLFNQVPTHQLSMEFLSQQIQSLIAVLPQLVYIQQQYLSLPPEVQQNPSHPDYQALSSMLVQIAGQTSLVGQSEYNYLANQSSGYIGQLNMINNLLAACMAETHVNPYGFPSERAPYPFQSIAENQIISPILPPNTNFFLNNFNFGSGSGSNIIDLSGFDSGVNVFTSNTQTFSTLLGIY
jgi:hypothetical protein